MGHDHSHAAGITNERALVGALALTASFMFAELVGGLMSRSLALISDAAHMFTDVAALSMALAALRLSARPADYRRTFGYYRFEILSAAFNAVLLFGVAVYILAEAYERLTHPPSLHSGVMFWLGLGGLLVNFASMRLLSHGKDSNLNIKGAYLEVWSDMLGSAGVVAGAVVIKFTGWLWIDSLVALAIGLWVMPRTWKLMREAMNVLLEGVPHELDAEEVFRALSEHPGVESVHDLHIWSIASGKISLTAHLVGAQPCADPFGVTQTALKMLATRFDIHHATLQMEATPCGQAHGPHRYGPHGHEDHAHQGHAHHHH